MTWDGFILSTGQLRAGTGSILTQYEDNELEVFINDAKPLFRLDLLQVWQYAETSADGTSALDAATTIHPERLRSAWKLRTMILLLSSMETDGPDGVITIWLRSYRNDYEVTRSQFYALKTETGATAVQVRIRRG